MAIILWKGERASLLCMGGAKGVYNVQNGGWELKLDTKTLKGTVLKTGMDLQFDHLTHVEYKGQDYNKVLNNAKIK